jgi:hypothetical protein
VFVALGALFLVGCGSLTVPMKQLAPSDAARLHELGPLYPLRPARVGLAVPMGSEIGSAAANAATTLRTVAIYSDSTGKEIAREPAAAYLSRLDAANSYNRGALIEARAQTPDPAQRVATLLSEQLQKEFGFTDVRSVSEQSSTPPKDGVRLSIQTISYALWYFPLAWKNRWLLYTAQVQLQRGSDDAVLWEAVCNASAKDEKGNQPTLEEVVANSAAKYIQSFERATTLCATQLTDQLAGRMSPIRRYK